MYQCLQKVSPFKSHWLFTFPSLHAISIKQNTVWWIMVTSFLSEHKLDGSHLLPLPSAPDWQGLIQGCFVYICINFQSAQKRYSILFLFQLKNDAFISSSFVRDCVSTSLLRGIRSGSTWSGSPFLLSRWCRQWIWGDLSWWHTKKLKMWLDNSQDSTEHC